MSRSGYSDDGDDDPLMLGRWRAQVESAIRGKRGQRFFLDLIAALDALPERKLISGELQSTDGEYCALGALGRYRGTDLKALDVSDEWDDSDWDKLSAGFDIAPQLAQETMYINDDRDSWYRSKSTTPEERWQAVRAWAVLQLKPETLIGKPELEIGT